MAPIAAYGEAKIRGWTRSGGTMMDDASMQGGGFTADSWHIPAAVDGEQGPAPAAAAVKLMLDAMNDRTAALADKMAERLASEQTCLCLYDCLLNKLDQPGSFPGGPTRAELTAMREAERKHSRLLGQALEQIAADSAVPMLPAVDEGLRLCQLLQEPRANVGQCLYMLIVHGLTGREAWGLLRSLAEEAGRRELASRIAQVEQEKEHHLSWLRLWLAANARAEAAALTAAPSSYPRQAIRP